MIQDVITRGGPVMVILLGCSLVSLGVILERFWFWLSEGREECRHTLADISREAGHGCGSENIDEIVSFCRECPAQSEIARQMARASERIYERSIRNLSALDTVVSIAPLLGILGTVLGIMKSFHALDLQHMTSPGAVGHGLAEAMITTAAGIAIAVPTLVAYNMLHSLAARRAAMLFKLSEDIGGYDPAN
jgi:biopolymer transport protein ExbB